MFRTLLNRLHARFRGRALDRELDEELLIHIERATEERVAAGMSPKQARRTALQAFGGMAQTREAYRLRRGLPIPCRY